ncbi:MAG TPA: GNAT family protein [Bauldia sp.]|nr:GNAT family protein [Bauldia sp.]
MDITLRPARPEDAEEMVRWFQDLSELAQWGGPDVRFPLSVDQMAGWIAEIAREQPRICLTAVDERDVPTAHVQYLRDIPRKWARIGRFAVARDRRGQGFGRAFFNQSVAYAFDTLGVEHLVLAVAVENSLARGMYERSGFRDEEHSTSVRSDGVAYAVDIMGLKRADWIKRSAPTGAAKVA